MKFTPHEYQQFCIDRIVATRRVGLFLDMGLGKTVISLTAVRILKYERFAANRILVIAPKKVAEGTWTTEAQKWDHLQDLRVVPVLGSEKQRLDALGINADVYVINRENVVWLKELYRNDWPFDMVIVDEASSFKNHSAKRFKALAAESCHIDRMVLLTGSFRLYSLLIHI